MIGDVGAHTIGDVGTHTIGAMGTHMIRDLGTHTIIVGEITTLVSLPARIDQGSIIPKTTSCHLHNLPGEVAVAMVATATVVVVTSMEVQGIINLTLISNFAWYIPIHVIKKRAFLLEF